MRELVRWRTSIVTAVLVLLSGVLVSGGQRERGRVTASDCTYLEDPNDYSVEPEARYAERSARNSKVITTIYALSSADPALDPKSIARKNFIDNAIFDRMAGAGIQSAPLTSDAEFLRRVMLDLTGRIPSPAELNSFLADPNTAKRDSLVDSLIGTPEFIDKWTMFLGDLYKNNSQATNVTRYVQARDVFYAYIKDAVARNKPYDQTARELITAGGDNFVTGEANWIIGGNVAGGPAQDIYDGQAVTTATQFLGINTVDCLLCHDGAHHLDQVNLWGSKQTRMNMWGLSAYFARTQMQRQTVTTTPQLIKFIVSDLATGDYRLNTTVGNRSARQTTNGLTVVAPKNPFLSNGGTINSGENRRQALARQITPNIQFSRAIVNYVWEKFMVEAFVSPSNSFDLARVDPGTALPAGWSMQPTNPELLNQLAVWFQNNKYDLRALMRLIATSNAYQLSSTYPGTWKVDYVPYYARHYVRRLDAEEIHDAIQKATGILNTYTFTYLPPVQWAMQLPETREPTNNNAVSQFLNSFGRGDRDLNARRSDGSGLQALNMMNNTFVMTRIHQNNQGSRVQSILSQTQDPTTIIRMVFQNTVSRNPSADETAYFLTTFQQQGARVAAESLQWVLLNKMDFLFNY